MSSNSDGASRPFYDAIAPYYELQIADYEEDLAFFAELAWRTGGPILELGAGSARVAMHLAGAGHRVTGVDDSPRMLALGRSKLPPRLRKLATLVQGDMRTLDLPDRAFALAFMADGTFAHLITQEEQRAALAAVRRHLQPSGLLVLALQNPYQWALDPAQNEIVFGWERSGPDKGEVTQMSYAVSSDRALQLRRLRQWYQVASPDGTPRRISAASSARWTYQPELLLLLQACGFQPEACYGSYDLDPYDAESPFLLVVASNAPVTNGPPPVFLSQEAERQEVPVGATRRARATKPATRL